MGKTAAPVPAEAADRRVLDKNTNLHQRMNLVMREVDYVQKEKKQGMRYSIVSHDAVTAKVRPFLVQYGIVYYPVELELSQNGNRTEARLKVRFVNIDNPTDYIDVPSPGYGIDDQDKGPGKAISYAVKYALLKAFGIESGDEPEEDQETTHRTDTGEKERKAFELALEGATDTDTLAQLDGQVRASYKEGAIDKATAQTLIGQIKKKVITLQEAEA